MGLEDQLKKFAYSPDDELWSDLEVTDQMESNIWNQIHQRTVKRKRRYMQGLVVACCLLLAIVPVKMMGLADFTTATYGSIFTMVGDERFQKIAQKGLTRKVDQTMTDMGVAVTISELYYDPDMLAFSYAVQFPETKHRDLTVQERTPKFEVKINGQDASFQWDDGYNESWDNRMVKEIQPHVYAGIVTLRPMERLPDAFSLELDIPRVGIVGSSGKWKFSIPVELLENVQREVKTTRPNQTINWYGNEVTIKEIRMSPSMLVMEVYQRIMPNRKIEGLIGEDAKGRKVQGGVRYIQSYDYKTSLSTLIFPPIHETQDSMFLSMWIDEPRGAEDRKKQAHEVGRVPFALSKANHQAEITNIVQQGEEARIYFRSRDKDFRPHTITLEDSTGEEYFCVGTEEVGQLDGYFTSVLIFPVPTASPIKKLNEYYFENEQGKSIEEKEYKEKKIPIYFH